MAMSAATPVEVDNNMELEEIAGEADMEKAETDDERRQRQKEENEKLKLTEYNGPVPLRKLFKLASRMEILIFAVGCLAAVAHGLSDPLICFLLGDLIDATAGDAGLSAFTDNVSKVVVRFCWVGVGIVVAGTLQEFCFGYFTDVEASKIRPLYFKALLYRDVGWFDTHDVGALPTEIEEELETYKDGLGPKLGSSIMAVSTLFFGYAFALYLSWQVALVMTAVLPCMAIGAAIMSGAAKDIQQERQGAYGRAATLIDEVLFAVRTVVSFGGEHRELGRYRAGVEEARRGGIRARAKMGVGLGYIQCVFVLSYALAFWFGMRLVYGGADLSAGKLQAAFFCVILAGLTVGNIPPGLAALAAARGSMARFFYILEHQGEIQKHLADEGEPCAPIETLELRDVHFAYPARPQCKVLDGVSFLIKKGQKVAVVGESGSGKSTVMALLERFYDPACGVVLVNGVDLRQLSIASYRAHVGYVGQEPVLFATSVKDNIMQGCPSATMKDVERVARFANLDFIDRLPQKFNTFVGSGGSQFSGGQKQRIAIARALLKAPSVLFLDEATSALDNTSERMIQDTIDSIGASSELGMTIVSIAHRLSTVKNADVIFVMKEGKVAEQGTHAELAARPGGIYRAFAAAQALSIEEPREEAVELERQATGPLQEAQATVSKKSTAQRSQTCSLEEEEREQQREKEIASQYKVPMARLLGFCRPEWWAFVPGIVGAVISGGAYPLMAVYALVEATLAFVLYTAPSDRELLREEVEKACILFVIFAAAKFVGTALQYVSFAILGESITKRCRVAMLTAIFRQEIGFHDDPEHTPARLLQGLQVNAFRISTLCITFGDKADAIASIGVGVVLAFIAQWQMALIMLASIPIYALSTAFQLIVEGGSKVEESRALKQATQVVSDSLTGVRSVHAAGNERDVLKLFTSLVQRDGQNLARAKLLQGIGYGFSSGIKSWVIAAGFWSMGYLIVEGVATFDSGFKAFVGILYAAASAGAAFALSGDVGKAKVSAHDMFQLLDRSPEIDGLEPTGKVLENDEQLGRIEFVRVKFFYPFRPQVTVLKELSFTVEAGQSVGLVGPSGGGKSTVLSLLQRFYDPQSGEVLVGWWRRQIGFVGQEPILFNSTVLENVKYGLEDGEVVPDERLNEVKRMANLYFLDGRKAQGWNTVAGPRGSRLSGGQKQRVAIARALLRNPPILLLDEATSALDSASERVVSQALAAARAGRTSFSIAHRLSTIQDCDVILVVADGVLAEYGNHEELMRRSGVYAKLHAQSGATQ
uniref:ABCB1 n=1 Tax=Prorocentrum lima TaxID=39448 RepID=A0A4P8ETW7_9DINO|nr:ABCB1 [Prorocentrum lima]